MTARRFKNSIDGSLKKICRLEDLLKATGLDRFQKWVKDEKMVFLSEQIELFPEGKNIVPELEKSME